MSDRPPFARDVNTVFQDYALFPHLTVADNIAYGLRISKVPKPERDRRTNEALDMVRLPGLGGRKPSQLSGGQRQRVALARAIVNHPKVLLLDEPLGALDLKLRQEMQVELKRIQQEVGITFVYVTHDQEEALTMSDRLAVFNEGKIVQVDHPAEIYERPGSEFVAGFVGVSNVLERGGRRFTIRPEKVRLLDADKVPVKTVLPKEGATGWSDTWMIASKSKHPNCMYMWMNHIISPKANAQVAEWFGEAPANQKSCQETADPNHCKIFHADDEDYFSKVSYWTTPTKDCRDDRGAVCKDYSEWVQAWTAIKG